jgi:hypothetical protein
MDSFMETVQNPAPQPPPEKIKVGPDDVTIDGNQVIIHAKHVMADWQVREYCRVPIYFRDKKYFLAQKGAAQKPYAMRYVLEAWPADNNEISRSALDYNEEVVAQREAAVRGAHLDDVVRAALLLCFPFLGMLWSKTKDKLARFGIISRTVTGLSIMLVFGVILLEGIFAKMLMMGSLRSGKLVIGGIIRTFAGKDYFNLGAIPVRILWLDCALFVLLVLDLLIRYSQHLRDDERNFGFLEWVALPFRKKTQTACTATAEALKPVV